MNYVYSDRFNHRGNLSECTNHLILNRSFFNKAIDFLWSTIFCTQYKQTEWHPRLGGGVIADAIMDRIVHNSETINSGTTNMRELLAKLSI